jgi:hypothetical protein
MACWLLGPEVASRSWDPEASWSSGPEVASRSWDPIWGSGLKVGFGIWDPTDSSRGPPAGSGS